jgi:hypothetical protein
VWSRQLIWGNHKLTGGYINPRANAWAVSVVWGAARTLDSGDNIVWGTNCAGGCDNIIWGTADDRGDNIIWGTSAADNIVWGTSSGEDVTWGTSSDAAELFADEATDALPDPSVEFGEADLAVGSTSLSAQ